MNKCRATQPSESAGAGEETQTNSEATFGGGFNGYKGREWDP